MEKGGFQLSTKDVQGNVGFDAQCQPLHIDAEIDLLKAVNAGAQAVSGTGTGLKLTLHNGNYDCYCGTGGVGRSWGLRIHGKNIRIHIPTVQDQLTGGMVTLQTLAAADRKHNVSLGRVNAQVTLDAQQAWQGFSVTARDGVGRGPGGLHIEGKRLRREGTVENGTYVYRGEASRIMAKAVDDAGRAVDIQLPGAVLTARQEHERTLTTLELPGNSHIQWGNFTFVLENGEGNEATMMLTPDGQVQDVTLRFPSPVEITNAADGQSATIKSASPPAGAAGQLDQRIHSRCRTAVRWEIIGLQVQLDDGRLSADLKAQELWADGKLAFVMQGENGAFAEVRLDKTDEKYWGTLHAGKPQRHATEWRRRAAR